METEKKTIGIIAGVIVLPLLIVGVLIVALGWTLMQDGATKPPESDSGVKQENPSGTNAPTHAEESGIKGTTEDGFAYEAIDSKTCKITGFDGDQSKGEDLVIPADINGFIRAVSPSQNLNENRKFRI